MALRANNSTLPNLIDCSEKPLAGCSKRSRGEARKKRRAEAYIGSTLTEAIERNEAYGSFSAAHLAGIDVHFVFFDAPAARDQFQEAAHVSANVIDISDRKSVLNIPTDELIFAEIYDLQIIVVGAFEVLLRSWRRVSQIVLQRLGNLYAHEQPFGPLVHHNSP